MSLMTELPKYWMDGAVRALDGQRRGLSDHYPLKHTKSAPEGHLLLMMLARGSRNTG